MKKNLFLFKNLAIKSRIILLFLSFCLIATWLLLESEIVTAQRSNQHGANTQELYITAADKEQILKEAGIRHVDSHYIAAGCEDHLSVEFVLVDLNGDKKPEVVLKVTGSPCFSGMMHSNVGVYVKSSQGKWRDTLGFLPAFNVRVQANKTKGYADLVLTVLGGCDPLYRWTGGSYYYAGVKPAFDAQCSASPHP